MIISNTLNGYKINFEAIISFDLKNVMLIHACVQK